MRYIFIQNTLCVRNLVQQEAEPKSMKKELVNEGG